MFSLISKLYPFLPSTLLKAFIHNDFFFNCHLENYLCVPWLEFLREYDLFSINLVSIPGPISCGQGWALVIGANVHSVGARYRPFEKEASWGELHNLPNALSIPFSVIISHFYFCTNLRTDFIGLNL